MIGGAYVDAQRLLIVAFAVALIIGLWLFTHFTHLGLAFRGIAQDERTSLTFGMDSDRIATLSVSFGAGLAAIAATVIIPLGSISPEEGYDVLIKALAVCIIGGLGSTGGVIVASFMIGFAERFTDTYIGSHWTMIVSLAALLLVLVDQTVRPFRQAERTGRKDLRREKTERADRPGHQGKVSGHFRPLFLAGNALSGRAPRCCRSSYAWLLPLVLSVYWQKVLISVAVFALLAITWDILAQSGMISLGQALFFGIGAYCSGILNHYWGFSPLITLPLAALFGGADQHPAAAAGLAAAGDLFFHGHPDHPPDAGASDRGHQNIRRHRGLERHDPLPSAGFEVYLVMIVFLAVLFGFRRLMDSDYGLVLKGISDNDRSVMNAGINIYWFKTQALFIAGQHRRLRRRVHDPRLHVCGHAGLCARLFHPAHRRRRGRGARNAGRGRPRGVYPGAAVRSCCGASAGFGSCSTDCFWWSSLWPCRRAFFTIFSANTISSNDGSRWKNEHSAAS